MSPCCFCPNVLPKTMMHIVVDTLLAFKTQKNVLGSLQSALAAGQIWSFNDFFVPLFTLTELKSSKTLTLASDENHINHVLSLLCFSPFGNYASLLSPFYYPL